MSKKPLVIKHDLSKLSPEELNQYLRDVSEFIGLDPDLNALDTIWMQNENGPGQSLVVYARRGTAEILRNKLGIEVISLTSSILQGSIVFTATGKARDRLFSSPSGSSVERQEVAIGSKYINGLTGKALDDAIMTASTRALRRLTMQFTTLGLLDESEVKATVGDTSNPASSAQLAGSPMVIPPVPTVANNAPGKDVTPTEKVLADPDKANSQTISAPIVKPTMQEMRDEATRQLALGVGPTTRHKIDLDKPVEPIPQELKEAFEPAKPKRARKSKNTVSLESGPEPETVTGPLTTPPPPATVPPVPAPPPTQASVPAPAISIPLIADNAPVTAVVPATAPVAQQANSGAAQQANPATFLGQPSAEQMADYRKKVSVYTSQLPSSENLGSVQKMRAFITKMSGTAPQFMTVDQWEETLGWFDEFSTRNQIKGLVSYINDTLGVK